MKNGMVDVNGELFKQDITRSLKEKMGLSVKQASVILLRKNNAYITQGCISGRFTEDTFETLCVCCGLDKDKYLKKDEPEEKKPEPAKQIYNEDIVVGLNSLYNLLNTLLSEVKTTNSLLREVCRKSDTDHKMLETINSNTNKATEKITAIFTDVHYKLR